MNLRRLRGNPPLLEKLAAEYVLGTLRGGARRRFESWLREDALVRHAVGEWQDRLQPMAEFAPPVSPSPQVWQAIAHRLDPGRREAAPSRPPQPSFWTRWRDSLAFWRGLGIASTMLAAILVAVLLARQPQQALPAPTYMATLADDKAQPVAVVTGDASRSQLTVRVLMQQDIAPDKSLELWALPRDGPPRSLGLVAPGGSVTLPLPENATPQSTPALAISLEPKGGSPNPRAPSGPVLYKGAWVQIS